MKINRIQSMNEHINDRLAYVDFKLRFTGHVSRADLKSTFGIAEAAASRVLVEYSCLKEANKTQKTNTIIRDSFQPLVEMNAEVALGMLANGFNFNKLSGNSELTYEKIGVVTNRLNVSEVAMITRAIFGQYAIICNYLSENSNKHGARVLVPHAIMYDGTTWMFRAFDRSEKAENKFKNFHFARAHNVIEGHNAREMKQQEHESVFHDNHWNLRVPLILKLHSSLSDAKKAQVRTDFGMGFNSDELYITEKAAFRWILEKKWFIDARSEDKKSQDKKNHFQCFYQFELMNLDMILNMEKA
jgi:hypothetical protein